MSGSDLATIIVAAVALIGTVVTQVGAWRGKQRELQATSTEVLLDAMSTRMEAQSGEIGTLKDEVMDLRRRVFSAEDARHHCQMALHDAYRGVETGVTVVKRLLSWADDGAPPPPPDVADELDQMVRVLPDGD